MFWRAVRMYYYEKSPRISLLQFSPNFNTFNKKNLEKRQYNGFSLQELLETFHNQANIGTYC